MVMQSIDVKTNHFHPKEDNKEILDPEILYLSEIGALMCLANCTWLDIAFSVNLLARYSVAPTQRHWKGVKHIFHYLCGTTDMGLLYSKCSTSQLVGFVDTGYLFDLYKTRSQTYYVYICGNTAISWQSRK